MTVNDTTARQIVGRKLYDNTVLRKDLDVVLAHLARDMPKYNVSVFKFNPERCVWQRLDDYAFNFNDAFFCHYSRYL